MKAAQGHRRLRVLDVSLPFVVILIVARAVVLLSVLRADVVAHPGLADDAQRFEELAHAEGSPYRNVDVEYLPGQYLIVRAIAGEGVGATTDRIAVIAFVSDLAIAALLGWAFGRRAAVAYLLLGLPLLTFAYWRLDLLVTAMSAGAAALARRGRWRWSGVVLGIATMTKGWPLALAPGLRQSRRALAAFAATVVVSVATWFTVSGVGASADVATFRGAGGWEIGSLVGDLVWIVTGGPLTVRSGALRAGVASGSETTFLGVVLLAGLALVWWKGRHSVPWGTVSLVAVTVVLLCSPVFSVQYALWLLPWAAVAASSEDDAGPIVALAVAALILTGAIGALFGSGNVGALIWIRWLVFARNVSLVALCGVWLARRWSGPATSELPEREPA